MSTTETSLTAARKWLDAGAEAHALGKWSESAASARMGMAYAQLATAEIAAAQLTAQEAGRLEVMAADHPPLIPTLAERAAKLPRLGVLTP